MLDQFISQLAERRARADFERGVIACWQQQLELTPEWKELQAARERFALVEEEADILAEQVRAAALDHYGANGGDKHPHPAVAVKVFDVLAYDPDHAKRYAIDHLPNALRLDRPAFERAAKVLGLEFVTVTKEPRAQISSDLAAYLERSHAE